MKKTEYYSFNDDQLVELLQNVGDDYTTLELIDEEKNVNAIVLSPADFAYLISRLDAEERETYTNEADEIEWS
ncbi:MAG: hypothetical protein ACK5MW_03170 [Enterococcus sp.]